MYKRNAKLVPITIKGVTLQVNPTSIDKSQRTVLHGEYKGTQVNSPAICQVGESVIFWPDADKPTAISMSLAAAGVFATKFLQGEGFAVSQTTRS